MGSDKFRAQGATEYLVILAVVLVIALISIALLGFFPGTASDTQIAENKMYWASATQLAIVESAAQNFAGGVNTIIYLRIRNVGGNPIQITGVFAGNSTATQTWTIGELMANNSRFMIPAGGETYLGQQFFSGSIGPGNVLLSNPSMINCAVAPATWICTADIKSLCSSSSDRPGYLEIQNFGFSYTEYVEGIAISKKEFGSKPLLIKCNPRSS